MIDYELEELFRQDSVKKNLIITDSDNEITLTNEDIYQESFKLRESLCSESELLFGSCEASEINFTTSYMSGLKGKEITVSLVLDDNTEIPFVIGTYIVVEDKLTADRSKREIVAYDSMYKINNTDVTSWYDSLSFPLSLKEFRDSFFADLEIAQETTTLVNDSIQINKTIQSNQLSGADVIRAICECNAVFGHIGRDNVFKYVRLSNGTEYNINPTMYANVEYEDYSCAEITGLQIRSEAYDIGVQVGTNDNAYIMQGNFLVAGYSTEALTPVANNMLGVMTMLNTYTPCKVNTIGNLCVEVGDRISVVKTDNETVDTWIMQRSCEGIQSLFDTFESLGEETRTERMNGIPYQITQLMGKSNVLERSIEQTRSEITDVEQTLRTEITQTASGIEIQIENLQSQIDGEIMYYEGEGVPTLLNYPYWDFCTNIPCNGTVQTTDDLRFVYTEQNKKDHLQDLYFDNEHVVSYRFVKTDGNYLWREIADGQTSAIMQRISRLEYTADNLTSEFTEIEKDVTAQGKQIITNTSNIEQTAKDITSEVTSRTNADKNLSTRITQNANSISTKVSKGDVCSEINQTSDQITLSSNRLVVNSTNFKLSKEGNVECSNMKITGGEISIPQATQSGGISQAFVSITRANGFVYGSEWGYGDLQGGATTKINSSGLSCVSKFNGVEGGISVGLFGLTVTGMLSVSGLKNRVVDTEHYGKRLQNAYETCSPYFGDIGEGQTDENGVCIIPIDEIFAETVSVEYGYQVFLQKYGEGDIYVAERNDTEFVVKGTPNLKFAWEMKARQKGYENIRLQEFNE